MIIFTDICLEQIGRDIAAHEPEVGGALLKLTNSNVICEFLADPGAKTSAASYVPSAELTATVQNAEHKHSLQFAGVIHSHPGNMVEPSGQDNRAFALCLAVNPHLAEFIVPIVTRSMPRGELATHQHVLHPPGVMTLHIAYRSRRGLNAGLSHSARTKAHAPHDRLLHSYWRDDDPRNDGVDLFKSNIGVLAIDADIAMLRRQLHQRGRMNWRRRKISYIDVNGTAFIRVALLFEETELVLLLGAGYPFIPPVVLLTPQAPEDNKDTSQVEFHWPISSQDERLTLLAEAVLYAQSNLDKNSAPKGAVAQAKV